jgi:hypothetical protein
LIHCDRTGGRDPKLQTRSSLEQLVVRTQDRQDSQYLSPVVGNSENANKSFVAAVGIPDIHSQDVGAAWVRRVTKMSHGRITRILYESKEAPKTYQKP